MILLARISSHLKFDISFFPSSLFLCFLLLVQGCASVSLDKPALYKDNNYIFPVDRFNVLVDLSGMNRFDYPPAPPLKIDRVSDALVSAFHGEMSSQSYGGAVQQVAVFSRIIGSAKHAEDSVEYNKEFYKKIFSFSNRNAPLFLFGN